MATLGNKKKTKTKKQNKTKIKTKSKNRNKSKYAAEYNIIQKIKMMRTMDAIENPGMSQVLAKGEQFLLLIK